MNLEQALKQASYKVWNELEPPFNSKHKIHLVREEALTSLALKEISKSNCPMIETIEMISSHEEKTSGYDFELAIGSKKNWVRFFIQSKKLNGVTVKSSYKEIKFDQCDKLISYSRSNSSLATYAFYNHLAENNFILADYFNSVTPFDRESLGITITSAYSVKALKSRTFLDNHYNAGNKIPLSLCSLKFFEHLFFYYNEYQRHVSIPFHEISYLTVGLAEHINKLHKKKEKKNILPFFFLGFGGDFLFGNDEDLIPIIRNTTAEQLASNFRNRAESNLVNDEDNYNPQALIIINTNE